MPKQKTHRGAAKRLSVTKGGKIKRAETMRRLAAILRRGGERNRFNGNICGRLGDRLQDSVADDRRRV